MYDTFNVDGLGSGGAVTSTKVKSRSSSSRGKVKDTNRVVW